MYRWKDSVRSYFFEKNDGLYRRKKKHFCDVDLHFCPASKWANETAECSPIADVGVIYFLIRSLLALAGQE